MVMMMRVTTEALRAGSTANFSSATPTTTVIPTARSKATGRGMPTASNETVLMPEIITNSP